MSKVDLFLTVEEMDFTPENLSKFWAKSIIFSWYWDNICWIFVMKVEITFFITYLPQILHIIRRMEYLGINSFNFRFFLTIGSSYTELMADSMNENSSSMLIIRSEYEIHRVPYSSRKLSVLSFVCITFHATSQCHLMKPSMQNRRHKMLDFGDFPTSSLFLYHLKSSSQIFSPFSMISWAKALEFSQILAATASGIIVSPEFKLFDNLHMSVQ